MFFKKKAIYKYNILEKYKIDINDADADTLEKMCENDNYNFYKFREKNATLSNLYILRQDKQNPKKVVFFGNYEEHSCIYKGHLFLAKSTGELNRFDHITCINVENGNIRNYRWKSKYGIMNIINGYGRFYNQDKITNVYVKDDILVFDINRTKTNDKEAQDYEYNVDMDYKLFVQEKGYDFVIRYSYEVE